MNFKSLMFVLVTSLVSFNTSFAQNPYEWVGVKHNEAVKNILSKMVNRPAAGTCNQTIRQLLQGTYSTDEFAQYDRFPEFRTYEERINYIKGHSTAIVFAKYQEIESALKTMQTVGEITDFANQKERTAAQDVPSSFLNEYLICLAILKASARFWLPVDKGGENGLGLIKFPSSGSGGHVQALTGWKILTADFSGTFFGALEGGPVGGVLGFAAGSIGETISQW